MRELGEREQQRGTTMSGHGKWHVDEIWVSVMLWFGTYLALIVFADVGSIRAVGVHQEVAVEAHPKFNCSKTTALQYVT
jgi:hypothetical protein